MFQKILHNYGINNAEVVAFGNGLINNTFLVKHVGGTYILQRINQAVFKKPHDIAANLETIGKYLAATHPGYLFIAPCATTSGATLVELNGAYRLFPFLQNSTTYSVVQSPRLAFEAARQFALFTHNLQHFNAQGLAITLPDFHNLQLRYQQFNQACKNGNAERIKKCENEIDLLHGFSQIAKTYSEITRSGHFAVRVTHHDTKISNVLFKEENGVCVIDLDTVMPGYFISDVGDMMRTYLSPVSEEETDLQKIEIRTDYFTAIVRGYLSAMSDSLSAVEKKHFVYAGKFMIYMQALRFLTDYLLNDVYYTTTYANQNLNRAKNQIQLLRLLVEKEDFLNQAVADIAT